MTTLQQLEQVWSSADSTLLIISADKSCSYKYSSLRELITTLGLEGCVRQYSDFQFVVHEQTRHELSKFLKIRAKSVYGACKPKTCSWPERYLQSVLYFLGDEVVLNNIDTIRLTEVMQESAQYIDPTLLR